jgi:hypothetical protein
MSGSIGFVYIVRVKGHEARAIVRQWKVAAVIASLPPVIKPQRPPRRGRRRP